MNIYLSNSVFLGNIDPFLASFDPTNPNELQISLNEKWIFVHPVALAMVAALGIGVEESNISIDEIVAKSGHYLARMGLLDILKQKTSINISQHEPAGRFIQLTQIKNSDELTEFLKDMIPLLHLEPKHAESIKYVISELVRNVLEHARTKDGAIVAAQYFKKSNTIKIGIVDTGVGIKNTINHAYDAKNDIDAIKLALIPGVTGTTRHEGGTEFNAGAGLFFVKSIANVNRNFFVIYSGNAMFKLLKRSGKEKYFSLRANPDQDKHSEKTNLPYWQGTVVGIDISLDATSEFTSLLDLVRNTYIKAVKERKKARYKKAKFI